MLEKLFGFDPSKMTLRKEVIGGITTFLTMAYILAVNPSILSVTGMDAGAVFTTTCISAVVATLVMAIYAKLPFALAPGMGLNAFFAFTVVLTMGYSWQFALTAVMIEGVIFILLTLTGLRQRIVNAIPLVLRRAISPGIGLFIAFVGLKGAGIVTSSESTFITLGNLHDSAVLLSIFGIILTAALLVRGITGALLIGILVTTIVGIPLGVTNYSGIMSAPPSISPIFMQFEWHNIFTVDMVVVVLTFLFIDMFDWCIQPRRYGRRQRQCEELESGLYGRCYWYHCRCHAWLVDGNDLRRECFWCECWRTVWGDQFYYCHLLCCGITFRTTVSCYSCTGYSSGTDLGWCNDDARHP